jgi:GAF domain-containing protein
MIAPPKPPNEEERLEALHGLQILDTPAEKAFDDLVRLASYICETPVAAVSFIDRDRQWFKAKVGIDVPETKRDISFCAHALTLPNETLIVPDASLDARFSDNPLVTEEPKIRFYAGAPLVTENGLVLGTLCVVDHVPKELTPAQIKALTVVRNQVMRELELHKKNMELAEANKKLEEAHADLSDSDTHDR